MRMASGKFAGKLTEVLLFKEPKYMRWYANQYPNSQAGKAYLSHLGKFDSKPFTVKCFSCSKVAQRASLYQGNPSPYFWCNNCDPYSHGAVPGKLTVVSKYSKALDVVALYSGENKSDMILLTKAFAEAMNGPKRITETAALNFL